MRRWRDCIVVLIDLIGIRKRALEGGSAASVSMRSFHQLVRTEMDGGLDAIDHVYAWNDSVLLLAYVDDCWKTYKDAIRAVDDLKRKVDLFARSYAIAVKGQAFPSDSPGGNSRVTVIKTSSWAMANCFKIEAEAKRKELRQAWYIDERIARKVGAAKAPKYFRVHLLPDGKSRKVFVHGGCLWPSR